MKNYLIPFLSALTILIVAQSDALADDQVTFSTIGIGSTQEEADIDAGTSAKTFASHSAACDAKGDASGKICTPKGNPSSDPDKPSEHSTSTIHGTTYQTTMAHFTGECSCTDKPQSKKGKSKKQG